MGKEVLQNVEYLLRSYFQSDQGAAMFRDFLNPEGEEVISISNILVTLYWGVNQNNDLISSHSFMAFKLLIAIHLRDVL